jgi:curved DNA-binding protein CbpA
MQQKLLGVDELFRLLGAASYYRLLGVSSTATFREIREAYFTSVRCFHPDTFSARNLGEQRARVEAVFEALTAAYETLRRPSTRILYDDSLGLVATERFAAEPASREIRDTERTPVVSEPPVPETAPKGGRPNGRPSVRPAAPRASVSVKSEPVYASQRPSAAAGRSMRPSLPSRPAKVVDTRPMSLPRERASAAARAERDLFVDDGPSSSSTSTRNSFPAPNTGSVRSSFSPDPGTSGSRNPFVDSQPAGSFEEEVRRSSTLLRELDRLAQQRLREGSDPPPEATVSLLEIANRVRGGGGVSKWAAARLQEAHQAEQAGRVVDAANIVRSVHSQLRDPNIEAHAHRLARLAASKR